MADQKEDDVDLFGEVDNEEEEERKELVKIDSNSNQKPKIYLKFDFYTNSKF